MKKSYKFRFELIGNAKDGPKVEKIHGDGEIGTGKGGCVSAFVAAKLKWDDNEKSKVKLNIVYSVAEDEWNSKKNEDNLTMSKDFLFDVSSFTQKESVIKFEGNKKHTTVVEDIKLLDPGKDTSPQDVDSSHYWFVFDAEDSLHDKLTAKSSISTVSNEQPWLPVADLKFKVDGKGKELEKEGNLALEGYVKFDIELVEKEIVEVLFDENPAPTPNNIVSGSGQKIEDLNTDAHKIARQGLGRGYDITGMYASLASVKASVLDLNMLNEHNHITLLDGLNISDNQKYTSTETKSLSSDICNSYNVKISAYAFGAAFKTETDKSFTEKESNTETSEYKKYDFRFIYKIYKVEDAVVPNRLFPFLSKSFKNDLNSMYPDKFIDKYGTHVLLGMQIGGRFTYNMRHIHNIATKTTIDTFTNTSSLGFDSSGLPKPKENTELRDSAVEKLYKDIISSDAMDSSKTAGAIAQLLQSKPAKETSTPSSSGGGGSKGGNAGAGGNAGNNAAEGGTFNTEIGKESFGGEISSVVSKSITKTYTDDYDRLEVTCYTVGGDPSMIGSYLMDEKNYDKWGDTVSSNLAFADFYSDLLIPIEDLIPSGYRLTHDIVEQASHAHQNDNAQKRKVCVSKSYTEEFNTQSAENTKKLNEFQDTEVDTEPDKNTGWEVHFNLFNTIEDGSAGCTIALNVHEGGLNKGKTLLQNTQIVKIDKEQYAQLLIDTGSPSFSKSGTITGKRHDWIDVTDSFRNCEFLDLVEGVFIKIDGSGGDEDNIGVKGRFNINYKAYPNISE